RRSLDRRAAKHIRVERGACRWVLDVQNDEVRISHRILLVFERCGSLNWTTVSFCQQCLSRSCWLALAESERYPAAPKRSPRFRSAMHAVNVAALRPSGQSRVVRSFLVQRTIYGLVAHRTRSEKSQRPDATLPHSTICLNYQENFNSLSWHAA